MSADLKQAILRLTDSRSGVDSFHGSAIDGLMFMRANAPTVPQHTLYRPALCINVQGAKRVLMGDAVFDYAELQYLVVSMDLPLVGSVTRASPEQPFLAIILELDVALIRALLDHVERADEPLAGSSLGVFVGSLDPTMADCLLRLVRLLDMPRAIPAVYPAIARELYYSLLAGPDGTELLRLAIPDDHARRVARAVHAIRADLAAPLRVASLARLAGMSASSFHHAFKAVTALSPLQYQKRLRLLEARRLMLAETVDAARAAYRVGYESPSQFSREYARLFGLPPGRDLRTLRAAPARGGAGLHGSHVARAATLAMPTVGPKSWVAGPDGHGE